MHPLLVRSVFLPLFRRLKGFDPDPYLAGLERCQYQSIDDLRHLQWTRLKAILDNAYRNVPYYRRAWTQMGLLPSDMCSWDDILALPTLSRADLKENLPELTSERADTLWPVRTGGSTGEPVLYLRDRDAMSHRMAIRHHVLGWWDIQPGDTEVSIWGSAHSFSCSRWGQTLMSVRRLRDRLLLNQHALSAYRLDPASLWQYAQALRRFRPKVMYCYTSAIYELARYVKEGGLQMGAWGLEAIICTAEPLYPFQRQMIESAFATRVINEYGSSEVGQIAFECREGTLHVLSPYVLVEILQGGRPVAAGEVGEVVVTLLANYSCPLIRYQLGDLAVQDSSTERCACGRALPGLAPVKGRIHDVIITPDGRRVHGELFTHVMEHFNEIVRFKVVQEEMATLRVLILSNSELSTQKQVQIIRNLRRFLGGEVRIYLELVDNLPLEPSGKFRWVVSHIDSQRVWGEH